MIKLRVLFLLFTCALLSCAAGCFQIVDPRDRDRHSCPEYHPHRCDGHGQQIPEVEKTPTRRPFLRPRGDLETSPTDPKSISSPASFGAAVKHDPNAVMTGQLKCRRCGCAMIGAQVSTHWLDDQTPATVLCTRCESMATSNEKRSLYESWLNDQPIEDRNRVHGMLMRAIGQ